ncbi:MAG: D-2-hydroxyacid dehydrogenase [Clostridiales bacterium]|nr:D-2-hydroxyacid dehydrogenase [Clostridiales bacterium]MCC8107021.1 D-2-hydroxyacid dehydrogenase [Clostridiales bacterium]
MNSQRIWKCISIEPLKSEWVDNITTHCNVAFSYVPRAEIEVHREEFEGAEVLLCRDRDLSPDFLDMFPQLEFLFIVSAGVEKLPFDYLKKRKIVVVNSGGISDRAMSDYVMGALLLFSCKFGECFEYKRIHYWKPYLMTESLADKRLLIVGAGKIGKEIARKAKVFDMQIIGVKQSPEKLSGFDKIITLNELDEELPDADYIVCTIPLTPLTYKLFDMQRFQKMKETAVFINISRGNIVEQKDLETVLKEKRIKGAVLDVFETEPLSPDSSLWDLENVVLTPHSSGRIEEYIKYAVECFIADFNRYAKGETMQNRVDLEKRY